METGTDDLASELASTVGGMRIMRILPFMKELGMLMYFNEIEAFSAEIFQKRGIETNGTLRLTSWNKVKPVKGTLYIQINVLCEEFSKLARRRNSNCVTA